MALTKIQIAEIKFDYCTGKLSQRKIAEKHGISRNTLIKYAKKGNWEYGKNEPKLNKIIEEKIFEQSAQNEANRKIEINNREKEITDDYLNTRKKYDQLIAIMANELIKAHNDAIKDGSKVSKKEYSRINAGGKAIKSLVNALYVSYSGARKALKMDDPNNKDKNIKPDPTEGMSLDEVREEIKKLESKKIND